MPHGARYLLPFLLLAATSCASLQPAPPVANAAGLPTKHQFRVAQYLFITDLDLKADHPVFKDLESLSQQISKELHLPLNTQLVHVYLFKERFEFEDYVQREFKNLPSRRAFFMARRDPRRGDELIVYTYWGDRVAEDLRHELTHATLHGVLKNVPLWLDEGLAEYFETPRAWNGLSYRHLAGFRSQPGVPWNPNLRRLEQLTMVKEMSAADYREAWAWIHFLLHHSSESRAVLLAYLQRLRLEGEAPPIRPDLAAVIPQPDQALREHLTQLESTTREMPGAP